MKSLTTIGFAATLTLGMAAMAPAMAAQGSSQGAGLGTQPNATSQATVNNQRILNEKAQGQGAPLTVSPAVVRQIKQALNEAGYDLGHVNGNWDKEAQKGMRNYQQAQGLEPTGNINLSTLATLGVRVGGVGMAQSGGQGGQGAVNNQRNLQMQGSAQGGQSGGQGMTGGQGATGGGAMGSQGGGQGAMGGQGGQGAAGGANSGILGGGGGGGAVGVGQQ